MAHLSITPAERGAQWQPRLVSTASVELADLFSRAMEKDPAFDIVAY